MRRRRFRMPSRYRPSTDVVALSGAALVLYESAWVLLSHAPNSSLKEIFPSTWAIIVIAYPCCIDNRAEVSGLESVHNIWLPVSVTHTRDSRRRPPRPRIIIWGHCHPWGRCLSPTTGIRIANHYVTNFGRSGVRGDTIQGRPIMWRCA